jgi:hypothetical protein
VKRLSAMPRGRSPRLHHTWQVQPFWPILASSWKNTRTCFWVRLGQHLLGASERAFGEDDPFGAP